MPDRIIEVYAGAYASGKSETSLNRARQFSAAGNLLTHSGRLQENSEKWELML